jgi:hypothetical protein
VVELYPERKNMKKSTYICDVCKNTTVPGQKHNGNFDNITGLAWNGTGIRFVEPDKVEHHICLDCLEKIDNAIDKDADFAMRLHRKE